MSNQIEESDKILRYAAYAVAFIIIVILGTYIFLNDDLQNRGTFGDMFGFANSLFTGLSFVGLLVTIILQRQDIKSQKQDLDKQNKAIQIQAFENTFFRMMDILFKILEEVFFYENDQKHVGKSAISMMHYYIAKNARVYSATKEKRLVDYKQTHFDLTDGEIREILKERFKAYNNQLSSYYRTIFNIIRMIDSNPFIDKQIYINILTSQLSKLEIMMIYYYGFQPRNEKEKVLIEKHGMLRDIDLENMLFPSFINVYKPSAYNN